MADAVDGAVTSKEDVEIVPGEPALGSFVGTARFSILRELGAGGMGVVYEAFDRERNFKVALKTLRQMSPDNLYRFKREFREFHDVQHPNLVALHELHCAGGLWFFTMDLVQGVDFLRWTRPSGVLDEARLRDALEQLTRALVFLHDRGKVHRDVKPSNIVVAADGRVVLLDFGIASDALRKSTAGILGTLAYMAPEQAMAEAPGPAADWYAVGAMLYEALTGQLPVSGSPYAVLVNKLKVSHPRPRAISSLVPQDLDELCADLLALLPAERPSGRSVLERLAPALSPSAVPVFEFVGRGRELAELREQFESAESRLVALAVRGESGVGKTALVQRFAELTARAHPNYVVLSSSCREREQVPFQAVDGLLDGLSTYLHRQPESEIAAVLPPLVGLIVEAFPVLGRVEAIVQHVRSGELPPDVRERRELMFGALRELLHNLSARCRLLLVVDDLQWADADSVSLLSSVFRQPDPPPLLCLATLRSDLEGPAQLLRQMQLLPLGQLEASDAKRLATLLLERAAGAPSVDAGAIAEAAAGHPLFIDVLVHHSARRSTGVSNLEEALAGEIRQLSAATRAVLEVVCVAASPISPNLVARALDRPHGEVEARIRELLVAHLLRSSSNERLDPYHARTRATVLAAVDAERIVALHLQLARALEAISPEDDEALAHHYSEAGQPALAAKYTEATAEKAVRALAFDRAARLFERCLQLDPEPPRQLCVRFADALVNAGQGARAGRAYLRAAEGAEPAVSLQLHRKAGEQLLRSGLLEEGLAALEVVLNSVNLKLLGPRAALASVVAARVRLRLRGLRFVERPAQALRTEDLARIDVYLAVALGLGNIDPIQAASLQTRCLLLALQAGDPARAALAMGLEAAFSAMEGSRTAKRTAQLLDRTESLCRRVGTPALLGWACLTSGVAAVLEGKWREARSRTLEAEVIFREQCQGASWELGQARSFTLWSCYFMGDIASLRRLTPGLLADAEARGDLYLAVEVRVVTAFLALLDGSPQRARDEVEGSLSRWSNTGFYTQHFNAGVMLAQIDLYAGEAEAAAGRLARLRALAKRSHLWEMEGYRIWHQHVAGCAALRTGNVDAALRAARRLERDGANGRALAAALRAGASTEAGQHDRASWRAAVKALSARDYQLQAACAQLRMGDAGGITWLEQQGVRDPTALADMLAPACRAPVRSSSHPSLAP